MGLSQDINGGNILKLEDSIILITGAAGGIGSKISTKLARKKQILF
ncbi:MAG: hypothetical protein R6U35_03290 [Candidatus Humimicrobiaceae bacterium]